MKLHHVLCSVFVLTLSFVITNTVFAYPYDTLTYFPAQTGTRGIAQADFNDDGDEDVVVLNANSNTATIFLGNGDGTFGSTTLNLLPTPVVTSHMNVGDFNNDGDPDLAFKTITPDHVIIGINDGTGTFATSTVGSGYAGNDGFPNVADLNNDGYDDFIVGDSVHINNQDNTFSSTTYPEIVTVQNVTFGDFDGDNYIDMIYGYNQETDSTIWINDGDGTFDNSSTTQSLVPGNIVRLRSGDLNGDGDLDLVTRPSAGTFSVLLGNGDGTFDTGGVDTYTSMGAFINLPELIDVDGDTDLDIVLNFAGADDFMQFYINDGTGDFTSDLYSEITGGVVKGAAAANFNEDGRLDLAVTADDGFNLLLSVTTDLIASPSSASVSEDGGNENITLTLSSEPDSQVDVTSSTANSEVTVTSGACLVPTGGIASSTGPYAPCSEWDTGVTFTISAIDDSDIEGAHSDTVTLTASSSDSFYNNETLAISINVVDNDRRGGGSQGGGGDNFNDDDDNNDQGEDEDTNEQRENTGEPLPQDLVEELEELILRLTELGIEPRLSGTPYSARAALNELLGLRRGSSIRASELQRFLAGKVLGTTTILSCDEYAIYHRVGDAGGDVTKIQKLLNVLGFLAEDFTHGILDQPTENAIRSFQAHASDKVLTPWGLNEPTGYWYKTTRKYANWLIGCSEPQVFLEDDQGGGYYYDYN